MEEIFESTSCTEILANDIKVNTTDICSTVNRELQGIQGEQFASIKYTRYMQVI